MFDDMLTQGNYCTTETGLHFLDYIYSIHLFLIIEILFLSSVHVSDLWQQNYSSHGPNKNI